VSISYDIRFCFRLSKFNDNIGKPTPYYLFRSASTLKKLKMDEFLDRDEGPAK